jgi:hypothetical protein
MRAGIIMKRESDRRDEEGRESEEIDIKCVRVRE